MARRSLRLRLTLAFGFGAAFLSILFAALAYFGVRHILVTDRQNTDLRQSYVNAALVRSSIVAGTPTVHQLISSLDAGTTSTSIVDLEGVWIANSLAQPRLAVPKSIRQQALAGQVARQVQVVNGVPKLFVDVPIPSIHATYFSIQNLSDLERTLQRLLWIIAGGALLTTAIGVAGGLAITRRALAPLELASSAAQRVASGALDTRIPVDPRDAEVATLAESFNEMVSQLVTRMERDARFAGDVSHELRSPLTTLATSVEVMRRSRDQFTPEGRAAFDLLDADVGTFSALVEDLLEIARIDAGAITNRLEVLNAPELVRQSVRSALRRHQLAFVPVEVDRGAEETYVNVDRRRFERVMSNLLENASRYAGGATGVLVAIRDGELVVDVVDQGPGIASDDRERIFDRFYRGAAAKDRGGLQGTGLGLALVAEHVRLLNGRIEVLSADGAGSDFRITLPVSRDE